MYECVGVQTIKKNVLAVSSEQRRVSQQEKNGA